VSETPWEHAQWPDGVAPNAPRQWLLNVGAKFHHYHLVRRDGYKCVNDSLAMLVVSRALVQSYPAWTDEHGTNVEQLAAIAIAALADHGLLLEATPDPIVAKSA
jgi:hypothetical protein